MAKYKVVVFGPKWADFDTLEAALRRYDNTVLKEGERLELFEDGVCVHVRTYGAQQVHNERLYDGQEER